MAIQIPTGPPGTATIADGSITKAKLATAVQTSIDKADAAAPAASPTFTGTVSGVTKAHVGLANVDNTSDANKPVSTATQTALNLKAPVDSPTFTGTVAGVTKTHVGLSNVDNTSDVNKPVSSATQTALNLKANLASPTFTGTVSGVSKAMVGLGNVDNTADVDKPVSTATQTALDTKISLGTNVVTSIPLLAGLYYQPVAGVVGTSTPAEGTEIAIPFVAGRTCTITDIGINIATAGSTGSVIRIGLRSNSSNKPGAVLVDAGTVDTSTTGVKNVTVSASVVAGTVYWLSVTEQGAATTRAQLSTVATSVPFVGSSSRTAVLTTSIGCYAAGTTQSGALGTVATWDNTSGNGIPRFSIFAAA